jgi:hypothetical protein
VERTELALFQTIARFAFQFENALRCEGYAVKLAKL